MVDTVRGGEQSPQSQVPNPQSPKNRRKAGRSSITRLGAEWRLSDSASSRSSRLRSARKRKVSASLPTTSRKPRYPRTARRGTCRRSPLHASFAAIFEPAMPIHKTTAPKTPSAPADRADAHLPRALLGGKASRRSPGLVTSQRGALWHGIRTRNSQILILMLCH